MSRVAKKPVILPKNVEFSCSGPTITLKGSKGSLSLDLHPSIQVEKKEDHLKISLINNTKNLDALAGTTRANLQNLVIGVSEGFEKKLLLVGVGYRAQMQANMLVLNLGFSHPVQYKVPSGIEIQTPTQTEIRILGKDKQQVGQVAADIRNYRKPEPYKGKGVRYSNEVIILKEGKKK